MEVQNSGWYYAHITSFPCLLEEAYLFVMSMGKVTVHAGQQVLIEVADIIVLIAGDPWGILGKQPRLYPIHLSNIAISIKLVT